MNKGAWHRWGKAALAATAYSLAIMVEAPSAIAQTSAQESAAQQFSVPAGPLGQSILAVSRAFGVPVLAPNALVEGKQAPAVSGAMTAAEALQRLLAGSDLIAKPTAEGGFVLAQQMPESGPIRLDPITVEGELLKRTVQDTQTSAVVITGEELERRGDVDLREVVERTPNISTTEGASESFVIRGIAQNGVGGAGTGRTITTSIDGARVSDSIRIPVTEISTWDLEQVEILRGPQSTQSGRNALAGAVIVRSKDPTYDYEAKALGGLGSFDRQEGAIAFNVPLIEDTLAMRLAVDHDQTDGATDNPTLGTDDANREERTTARLSLRFDPFEDLTSVLKVTRFTNEGTRGFVDRALFPEKRVFLGNVQEKKETVFYSVNLRNEYAFNDYIRLVSETNYFESDFDELDDRDQTATAGGTNTVRSDTETVDQELRLLYERDGLNIVLGGFYADIDDEELIATVSPAFSADALTKTETENVAFFGEVEYGILPQLTLIAGGRYDREKRDTETASTVFPTPFSSTTYDAFLSKLGAVYRFTDDVSLGFTYQTGYRAGGTSVNFSTLEVIEFDPEFTDNYELAFRSQWYNDRITFNANLFYTEWTDQQVFVGTFPDRFVTNAGESQLFGGEIDLRLNPISGLELFGSLGYVDTEFTDFINNGVDFSGNEFPNAPDFTVAFGAEYLFESGFFIAGDASYTASAFTNTANTSDDRTDSRLLVNARAGYEAENWNAVLYATNIFDVDYVSDVATATSVIAGDPLQFGVRVGIQF